MVQEVIELIGMVVVRVVVHESESEGGQSVVFGVVEGSAVGLDDGRVIGGKLYEIVDDIGEEDYEEDGGADEGGASGD